MRMGHKTALYKGISLCQVEMEPVRGGRVQRLQPLTHNGGFNRLHRGTPSGVLPEPAQFDGSEMLP